MSEKPPCFGNLEIVFPMGKDGLRASPESCMACEIKTDCLGTAIRGGGGLDLKEEKLDRESKKGQIGFFERWSRKKAIERARQKK